MVVQQPIRVGYPELAALSQYLIALVLFALLNYSIIQINLIPVILRRFCNFLIVKFLHPPVLKPVHRFYLHLLLSTLYQLHPFQQHFRKNLPHYFPNKHFHSIAQTRIYLLIHRVFRMLTAKYLQGFCCQFATERSALPQIDSALPTSRVLSPV